MRRALLMAFCLALLEGAALAQAPDVGIKYYVVDRSQYFTSNFTYDVEAGQQMILNICYANAGSANASGMSYTMTLPTGLSDVAVTSTQAGSTSGTYNSGTGALTITGLADPLLAGSQLCPSADAYLYYFSRAVVSFTAPSSTFDAVAMVATSIAESPDVLPDSITGHFVVSGGPPTLTDLRVLIEGPVAVGPGVPIEYTVGAQNLGPRDAQNVAVSVRLPLGTTGVTVGGGTFDAASGLVSWPIVGTLAVGGQQMFSFSITNPPLAQGVASVLSDNHETDYFNNVLPFNLSPATVVPNAEATADGNIQNDLPFSCAVGGITSMRYQQVYLASEVGSGTVTQLAFRQKPGASAFGPTTIVGMTITLSSTSNGPDSLSTTFASNVGADVTTVFSGDLALSGAGNAVVSPNAAPFDILIPLQTSFPFNAALGKNLLLDVTVPTCVLLNGPGSTFFDAQITDGDSVSRIFANNSGAASGVADSAGLITQFTGVVQPAPVFQSAISRKVHGAAGTFDLPLSPGVLPPPAINHNPTTEPRQGPTQTIVFTFDKPLNAATVSIDEGTAIAGAPSFSGNSVIVDLAGVTDRQYVTVSLSNVASTDGGAGGSGSVRVGFLVGDVNQNRVVSVADLGLVNAQLTQPVTAINFLKDVNASGAISVADKGITNANLTKALPTP